MNKMEMFGMCPSFSHAKPLPCVNLKWIQIKV